MSQTIPNSSINHDNNHTECCNLTPLSLPLQEHESDVRAHSEGGERDEDHHRGQRELGTRIIQSVRGQECGGTHEIGGHGISGIFETT